jgi:tetratricopeptide (TPR) repeat protein
VAHFKWLITCNFYLHRLQLIDVEDGAQLWGAKYDCRFSAVFEIQEEIATEVSEKLALRLTSLERKFLTKRYTENTEAYRHYLKGRFFWNKRSIKGIKKAIKHFQQAIDLDAGYTLAYSGLTDCYITLAGYGVLAPSEVFPKAKRAVLQALALDNSLAEAHASLANIRKLYDLNWVEAEKEYLQAIELNPSYASAHQWYADYLSIMGRFDEAIGRINLALEIEPLSLIFNKTMAKILYMAREYDKGAEQCLEILEIEPGFGPASGQLAYIYAAKGMYREAITEIQKLIDFASGDYEAPMEEASNSISSPRRQVVFSQSDPEAIAALGYFYALAGRKDEALELAHGLKELCRHRYVEPHTLAMIYIGLRDHDLAFGWLEKAYATRSSVITHLKVWPVLDSLRSDPRFLDLYQRVGFTS